MKKLIIIAAVVCAAFASHAAAYTWKTATTGKVYEAGTTTTYSGMAYIFADAGATARALVFAALVNGTDITALGALDSSTISSGAIAAKSAQPFEYSGDITAYFAIVNGDNFYIGPTASAAAQDVGSATLSFSAAASSKMSAMDGSAGYQGAGWYTQSVPEPTSGLLMLLGMAGLALRRRRA